MVMMVEIFFRNALITDSLGERGLTAVENEAQMFLVLWRLQNLLLL